MKPLLPAMVGVCLIVACGSTSGVDTTGTVAQPVVGSIATAITINSATIPAASGTLAQTEQTATLNTLSDGQLNLLVRLYLDDGNMLQWYEPAPGHLLLIGVSASGQSMNSKLPGWQKLLPTALFSALEPGMPVPTNLQDAQQRATLLAASGSLVPKMDAGQAPPSSSAGAATPSGDAVVPLTCGSCTNYCAYSCWSCRACSSGDDYDWCYQDAYNGAYSDNGGNQAWGWGDICSVQGNATLTITSNKYNGNYTVGVNQECWEWSYDEDFCLFDQGDYCNQNIHFAVTGSSIDVRFGGYFTE